MGTAGVGFAFTLSLPFWQLLPLADGFRIAAMASWSCRGLRLLPLRLGGCSQGWVLERHEEPLHRPVGGHKKFVLLNAGHGAPPELCGSGLQWRHTNLCKGERVVRDAGQPIHKGLLLRLQ